VRRRKSERISSGVNFFSFGSYCRDLKVETHEVCVEEEQHHFLRLVVFVLSVHRSCINYRPVKKEEDK
jgi:hypothetical protein